MIIFVFIFNPKGNFWRKGKTFEEIIFSVVCKFPPKDLRQFFFFVCKLCSYWCKVIFVVVGDKKRVKESEKAFFQKLKFFFSIYHIIGVHPVFSIYIISSLIISL